MRGGEWGEGGYVVVRERGVMVWRIYMKGETGKGREEGVGAVRRRRGDGERWIRRRGRTGRGLVVMVEW